MIPFLTNKKIWIFIVEPHLSTSKLPHLPQPGSFLENNLINVGLSRPILVFKTGQNMFISCKKHFVVYICTKVLNAALFWNQSSCKPLITINFVFISKFPQFPSYGHPWVPHCGGYYPVKEGVRGLLHWIHSLTMLHMIFTMVYSLCSN